MKKAYVFSKVDFLDPLGIKVCTCIYDRNNYHIRIYNDGQICIFNTEGTYEVRLSTSVAGVTFYEETE